MNETTRVTSHMCHELQLFIWEKPHSLVVDWLMSPKSRSKTYWPKIHLDSKKSGVPKPQTNSQWREQYVNVIIVKRQWVLRRTQSFHHILMDGSYQSGLATTHGFGNLIPASQILDSSTLLKCYRMILATVLYIKTPSLF
jgi:hypothetical protein